MDRGDLKYMAALAVLVLIMFLPALMHPDMMMGRGDDNIAINGYYLNYARRWIAETGKFPLWDTDSFSGSPFVGKTNLPFWFPVVNIGTLIITIIVITDELKKNKKEQEAA